MWMFTTIGFFSIVAHEGDVETIVIRAHAREDLERLRRNHLPDLEILDGPCAYVSRDEWEHAAQGLAAGIDYSEFDPRDDVRRVLAD